MNTHYGWAGKILCVDLSDSSIAEVNTYDYAPLFFGGRGIASRMYWEEMSSTTGAFDPDNYLYMMNGPLTGTQAPAASRWIISGKSPMCFPEQYACGNLGGHLGAALKWVGLDGLTITGASRVPVVIVIDSEGKCLFKDAADLWGKDVFETIELLQAAYGSRSHVATIGRAGEMRVRFANVIGSGGVSVTKGFGAVMGAKKLKAIVVTAHSKILPVAQPEAFRKVKQEIISIHQGEGAGRFGQDLMLEDIEKIKGAYCYGCPGVCGRGIYQNSKGEQGYRKTCVSAYFYSSAEKAKTGKMGEASFHATQLANKHGLCTMELRFLATWLPVAMKERSDILTVDGLDPDEIGTSKWIETLVDMIVNRRGVGDLLAEGSRRSSRELGVEELLDGVVTTTGFDANVYSPRFFLSTAPLYATESVFPITQLHEISFPMVQWMIWMGTEGTMGFLTTEKLRCLAKKFWGDERAAEFDSPTKMGEAAARIQNRAYAKENFVLCDWFWPIHCYGSAETGIGDPSLEARLFSAITGEDMDEDGFLRSGERAVNLCRAIYLREGRRGREDDKLEEFNFTSPLERQGPPIDLFNPDLILPGKDGKFFKKKGATLDRDYFSQMMDDYYQARGWDSATGFFTRKGLMDLNLIDLIDDLDKRGFVTK